MKEWGRGKEEKRKKGIERKGRKEGVGRVAGGVIQCKLQRLGDCIVDTVHCGESLLFTTVRWVVKKIYASLLS